MFRKLSKFKSSRASGTRFTCSSAFSGLSQIINTEAVKTLTICYSFDNHVIVHKDNKLAYVFDM